MFSDTLSQNKAKRKTRTNPNHHPQKQKETNKIKTLTRKYRNECLWPWVRQYFLRHDTESIVDKRKKIEQHQNLKHCLSKDTVKKVRQGRCHKVLATCCSCRGLQLMAQHSGWYLRTTFQLQGIWCLLASAGTHTHMGWAYVCLHTNTHTHKRRTKYLKRKQKVNPQSGRSYFQVTHLRRDFVLVFWS